MADVKIMSDALPLISLNALNAARLSSQPESPQLRVQAITARVVEGDERPIDGQYKITLETDGRQFKVLSEQPLPKDAELKLQLLIASQKSSKVTETGDDNLRSQTQQTDRESAPTEKTETKNTARETAARETIKQIRVIAVDGSKTQQTITNTPLLNAHQSAQTASHHSNADIAANLKRLAALLLQSEQKGQPLKLARDLNTQDLKQWLAQKLPLTLHHAGKASTTATLYEKGNPSNSQPDISANTLAGTTQSNRTTPLLRLLPTITQLLNKPDVPLDVKQQINQYLTQLTSATKAHGSLQQIQNSGLSYEAKLTKLLVQVAQEVNQPAKTAADSGVAAQPVKSVTSQSAATLFRQLWQQGSATVGPSATTVSSTTDSSQTGSRSSAAGPQATRADGLQRADTSVSQSVSDLLNATKQKLESAVATATAKVTGNSDSTVFSNSLSLMSDQLQQLQSSDQKAVLSKSLQMWLNQINATRTANNEPTQNLQQLGATLQERLPEGFRLLQGALAQIELEQSQRLQQSQDQWQLNIPLLVRQDQQLSEVRMQIFKEQSGEEKTDQKERKQRWRIHLHFDLTQLGPLDVEVDMTLPKMAATFWSTQAATLAELSKHLQPLRSKLSQLGVEVETLNARHGRLAEAQRNQIQTSLVDLHT